MDEFIGCIKMFGFNFAPRGWMLCQGQTLSIAQNTALFSLLGTTYGGNGQTTFALPNLGGRVAIGQGQSPGTSNYQIGQIGGVESMTLTQQQMPAHTHPASATSTSTSTSTSSLIAESNNADAQNPNNRMLASGQFYTSPNEANNRTMAPESIATTTTTNTTTNVTVGMAGGNLPFSILTPYVTVNYAICTEGIFPPRN